MLHPQAFRHVHRHGQRGEPVVKNHWRPDDLDINQAAILAAVPPDKSLAGGIRDGGLVTVALFQRADVRNGHGEKFRA